MVPKSGILANAPLVFVLSAVKFQALEYLPNWIPEIQEALRDRFPVFNRMRQVLSGAGVEVSIDPPDFTGDMAGSAWLFTNEARTTTVQLSRTSLVLHTSEYSTFDDFAADITLALTALLTKAGHINVDVIGIRYIDHIQPQLGHSLDAYVPRELLPFQANLHLTAEVAGGISLTSYRVGEDLLQVRFSTGNDASVIPEDLAATYLTGKDFAKVASTGILPLQKLERGHGTLDTDAARIGLAARRMDAGEIVKSIDRLHGIANAFFRDACTDHAFAGWQKERI